MGTSGPRPVPDGQLYLNLRGYDLGEPVTAAEALARALAALGVAAHDIPLDLDERAARYRAVLSGRRVLVVLDNAGTVDQVRPLLPGAPTCTVVVTSRDSLAGVVAVNGAHRIELNLLPVAGAQALLRRLIGPRAEVGSAGWSRAGRRGRSCWGCCPMWTPGRVGRWAEQAGDASPHRIQRLLGEPVWDAEKVRDDVRGYVVDALADPAGVLIIDDIDDLKKGRAQRWREPDLGQIRILGERAIAILKTWKILTKLRRSPHRATAIVRAIVVLQHAEDDRCSR